MYPIKWSVSVDELKKYNTNNKRHKYFSELVYKQKLNIYLSLFFLNKYVGSISQTNKELKLRKIIKK